MNFSTASIPAHAWLVEPELVFHPDRPQDHSPHPLKGLLEFGPFSRSGLIVVDPIRIAAITPQGESHRLGDLLRELESRHRPVERVQYLPEFPGFSRVFGVGAKPVFDRCLVELPADLDNQVAAASKPHVVLAEALTRALSVLDPVRAEFDVVMILLPTRWSAGFEGGTDEDFDLHDYLKALTASRGIPIQLIREDKALTYKCRCSVMWRLGIATYSKVGGVPWKLAETEEGTAFIGLSYAMARADRPKRFVTCCSQVFDADGAGLEFILYETDDVRVVRENPFLSRSEMRRVMSRSLAIYQRRHAGRAPRRVVIHKSTLFTDEEQDGCFEALSAAESLELIQIQQDVVWSGVHLDKLVQSGKAAAAAYPCHRGTFLSLSEYEVLLWTQGNAPTAVGGQNYFKEGKGIPHPLLLKRFAGHGGWNEPCRAVLGLTKMNWNNDGLYDRLPVTLEYAQTLARTVKRMPKLEPRPYQFRFFM